MRRHVGPILLTLACGTALSGLGGCGGHGAAESPTPTPTPTVAPTPTPAPTALPHYFTGAYIATNLGDQITNVTTTMTVPAEPPAAGLVYLWPGLESYPGAPGYVSTFDGVLQPVLTWGSDPGCPPAGTQPPTYSTWWIAAVYVEGTNADTASCAGGGIMSVDVGDTLSIDMSLSGTTWNQVVTDEQSANSVSFSNDMQGEAQIIADFTIEGYRQYPMGASTFTNTRVTFASADAADCAVVPFAQPQSQADSNDIFATAVSSDGGLTCLVSTITLYDPDQPVSPGPPGQRRAPLRQLP